MHTCVPAKMYVRMGKWENAYVYYLVVGVTARTNVQRNAENM